MPKASKRTLARHDAASQIQETFDWRQLVSQQRPGEATAEQREQSARIARIAQGLQQWAARYALPPEHLHQASYFAVVSTEATLPDDLALALAEAIFWIYVFDDFLDQRLMTTASDVIGIPADTSATLLAAVDADIRLIATPVAGQLWPAPEIECAEQRRARRTSGMRAANLLNELLQAAYRSPGIEAKPLAVDYQAIGLRDAFQSLLTTLSPIWRSLSIRRETATYRESLVCRQFVRCMASMRREFHWNLQLAALVASNAATTVPLPSIELYQLTGAVSIGMYAVAAVVASFEVHPHQAWQSCLAAIDAGGRIVRLANDIATYTREAQEGKLTAITLALSEQGYPLHGLDPEHSPEVRSAQNAVSLRLRREIAFFSSIHGRLTPYPLLAYYLCHVCAFALAFYGDGSQYLGQDA